MRLIWISQPLPYLALRHTRTQSLTAFCDRVLPVDHSLWPIGFRSEAVRLWVSSCNSFFSLFPCRLLPLRSVCLSQCFGTAQLRDLVSSPRCTPPRIADQPESDSGSVSKRTLWHPFSWFCGRGDVFAGQFWFLLDSAVWRGEYWLFWWATQPSALCCCWTWSGCWWQSVPSFPSLPST